MNMKCPVCGGEQYTVDLQEKRLTCAGCGFYCDFEALVRGAEPRRQVEQKIIDERLDFEIVGGVLKKYNGAAVDVVVPEGVVEIRSNRVKGVFHDMKHLRSVTLPKGLKIIGDHTFSNCTNLSEINLPDSLEVIGREAFLGCSSLKSIRIPNSVIAIRKTISINSDGTPIYFDMAFRGCSRLIHAEYPKDRFTYRVFKGTPYFDKMERLAIETKICPECGQKWRKHFSCRGCGAAESERERLSKFDI